MFAIKTQSPGVRTKTNAQNKLNNIVAAGFDTIIFNAFYGGAHCQSNYIARCPTLEVGFDPLKFFIEEGKKVGIKKVYVWFSAGQEACKIKPEWDLCGKNGFDPNGHWTDFSQPAARQWVADVTRDLISNYDCGVSLDYIRYPDNWYFSTTYQWRLSDHPECSREDIATTVQLVRDAIGIDRVTANVRTSSMKGVGQHWEDWLNRGLVNKLFGSTYSNSGEVDSLTKQVMNPTEGIPGIPTFDHSKITPVFTLWEDWTVKDVQNPKPNDMLLREIAEMKALGFTNGLAFHDNNYISSTNTPILLAEAQKEKEMTVAINLTGISSGNNPITPVAVTAVASNPSLFSSVVVNYTDPSPTGTIALAPVPNSEGTSLITVTVDNHQPRNNTTVKTFTVNLKKLNPPTLDPISDVTIIT
jgi:hypothetical protein